MSFLVSFSIHVLVFYFLFAPQKKVENSPPIDFEIVDIPSEDVKVAPSQIDRGGSRNLKSQLAHPSLRSFIPSSAPRFTGDRPSNQMEREDLTDHQIYNDALVDILGENADWSFLKYLHQKIDHEIVFDSVLAQWNHFGTVFVEFWIDGQGLLMKDKIRVQADDPILKVHSMRALRRALVKPFEEIKQSQTGSLKVRAKFIYIYGDPDLNFEKQRTFSKKALIFQRATLEKPIPSNLTDHLASGGISYDPFLMYERWTKYNHKKSQLYTEFDPFKGYREDPDFNL